MHIYPPVQSHYFLIGIYIKSCFLLNYTIEYQPAKEIVGNKYQIKYINLY